MYYYNGIIKADGKCIAIESQYLSVLGEVGGESRAGKENFKLCCVIQNFV